MFGKASHQAFLSLSSGSLIAVRTPPLSRKNGLFVSVHQDENKGGNRRQRIDTNILARVAKHLGTPYSRGGRRTWDTVRNNVLKDCVAW